MKTLALVLFLTGALAHAQDGGLTVTGPITMITPHGGTVTLTATDYPNVADGGLITYLQVDATGGLVNSGYLFTDSLTFLDDGACLNWPTAGDAFCEDIGESTLSTIKITTPYNLQVRGTIDAGSLLQNGAPVCTSCPCTP